MLLMQKNTQTHTNTPQGGKEEGRVDGWKKRSKKKREVMEDTGGKVEGGRQKLAHFIKEDPFSFLSSSLKVALGEQKRPDSRRKAVTGRQRTEEHTTSGRNKGERGGGAGGGVRG